MEKTTRQRSLGLWGSILAHGLAGVLVLALARGRHVVYPVRLPGSRLGTHLALEYSLGGSSELRQSATVRSAVRKPTAPRAVKPSPSPAPLAASAAPSEKGTGAAGESAFGDENLRVALPQVHPRPQPDLSPLPKGTAGDVVVDVDIDAAGKVTGARVVKGLAASVDESVMQTLLGWVFQPATLNGENVASQQEILIHYERA